MSWADQQTERDTAALHARRALLRDFVNCLIEGEADPARCGARAMMFGLVLRPNAYLFTPQAEIARQLGISEATVSRSCKVLKAEIEDFLRKHAEC